MGFFDSIGSVLQSSLDLAQQGASIAGQIGDAYANLQGPPPVVLNTGGPSGLYQPIVPPGAYGPPAPASSSSSPWGAVALVAVGLGVLLIVSD